MTEITKIDRAGLVDVYETLAKAKDSIIGVLPRFTAASLRKQLEVHVEPIIEQRTEAEKKRPAKFDEEREALCKEMAVKNESGEPVISGMQYLIQPGLKTEFDTKLAALKDKYNDDIKAFEEEAKRVNEFLREDIDFPTINGRLKLSWFKDSVDQQHLESLMPLIDADVDVVQALADAKTAAKTSAK